MRRHFGWLTIPLLLVLGGCATQDEMHSMPVAGGRVVDIPFGPNGPRPGHANGFEVRGVRFSPGVQDREILYYFAFSAPPGAALKSVQVDDISDLSAHELINDQHPWVTDGVWQAKSKPITASDPQVAWIFQVTPAIRIFRFTIIDANDRRSVMYQLEVFPDFLRATIRKKWGEKY